MTTAALQPANTLIREVVAVYNSCEELDIAITDLIDAGFKPTQLGLVARKEGIRSHLGGAFTAGVSVLGSSESLQATLASKDEFQRLIKALNQDLLLLFVSSYNTEKLIQAKQVLEFSDSIDNGIVAYTVGSNPCDRADSVRLAS